MQLNQAKNLSYFESPFYLGIELQHPEAYLPRARLPVELTMAVLKHGEDIIQIDPMPSDSIGKDLVQNTEDGHRSEVAGIAASPSETRPNGTEHVDTRGELTRLATGLHSTKFEDPVLDPTSPAFDAYKWSRMVVHAADKAGVKLPQASFTFKNLTVWGSRSTSHFQSNVASIFMVPFRLSEYFRFGKQPQKAILKRFDGVTKSGELLLVLGRPGSGCSTFLKTIAGELHGLKVDGDSMVHYNGSASQKSVYRYLVLTSDQVYPKRR
jgi:hypothetical protein